MGEATGGAGAHGQQGAEQPWQHRPGGGEGPAGEGGAEIEGAVIEADATAEVGQEREQACEHERGGQEAALQQLPQPRAEPEQGGPQA